MTDYVRKNLEKLLRDTGKDMKEISTDVLGKNHSYLYGFLKRGAPAHLSIDSRLKLIEYFNVEPGMFFSPVEMKRTGVMVATPKAALFDELCNRAGQTPDDIANLCGYETADQIRDELRLSGGLPPVAIDVLMRKLVGRGNPPVLDNDVMTLATLMGFHSESPFPATPKNSGFASGNYTGTWSSPDKIPVLAYAAASGEKNAVNLEHGIPIRWIERPHWLVGVVKAAAAQIMGDSMYPRYMDGDLVFINMSMPPVKGKDCIFNTKDGYTHIKQYLGQDKEYVRFHQWNPSTDISIHKRDIESMYAIVGRD